MSRRLIISLAAAIAVFLSVSCAKDDTLRDNNATMGNIVEGVFISDQGNRFNIVEQAYPGNLQELDRAFIVCDVLDAAEAENEYNVRLNFFTKVLLKDAKAKSEISDMETYMNDPLMISDIWFSGGYINFLITVPVKSGSGKTHEVNLLYEKVDGKYFFNLRHDAQGEILKDDNGGSGLVLANGYVSFPVNTIISEESAKIEIEWNSYTSVLPGTISSKTETYKRERDYTKSTFEHVPGTETSNISVLSVM